MNIVVTEYQKLVAERSCSELFLDKQGGQKKPQSIADSTFDWLLELAGKQQAAEEATYVKPCFIQGQPAVQFHHYVGVIRAPDGTQIEILPKITNANHQQSRDCLIRMLKRVFSVSGIMATEAELATFNGIHEWLMARFLKQCATVVKAGLAQAYQKNQQNLPWLKGKLLVSQQIKKNLNKAHYCYSQFDQFNQDRPENQLLLQALKTTLQRSSSPMNIRLAKELICFFGEISDVDWHVSSKQVHLQRGMAHYQPALASANLLLKRLLPFSQSGSANGWSFLFAMPQLFESYISQQVRHQLDNDHQIKTQPKQKSLACYSNQPCFSLQPDLLITKTNQPVLVADCKWKLLDTSIENWSKNFSIAQSDFYQLFAYGEKYLNGQGTLLLIYPKSDHFPQSLAEPFVFTEQLNLWVIAYDLQNDHFDWPNELNKDFIHSSFSVSSDNDAMVSTYAA